MKNCNDSKALMKFYNATSVEAKEKENVGKNIQGPLAGKRENNQPLSPWKRGNMENGR